MNALLNVKRPVRPVDLPGGSTVHVRDLTLGELRRIDALADEVPDGSERNVRYALLLCAYALADAEAGAMFEYPSTVLDTITDTFTVSQIQAINRAAIPEKDAAKNA